MSVRRYPHLAAIAVLIIATVLLTYATSAAEAATVELYAAPSAKGNADCSAPAHACKVTDAVSEANATPNTETVRILLAEGTYPLSAPSPTALEITFSGARLSLEPSGGPVTLNGMNTVRLLKIGAASNVQIDGLTFELAASANGLGGAIENDGTLTIRNSRFVANKALYGAGIANSLTGTLHVESSTFIDNAAISVGGGGIINLGSATVLRSFFMNNSAGTSGGAINNQTSGNLLLSSSTVTGNKAGGIGAGVSNLGTLKIQLSTIDNNQGVLDGSAVGSFVTSGVEIVASILRSGDAYASCRPSSHAFDGGYNLDDDGSCISPTSPATGSHAGSEVYGTSTYGAVLNSYLADASAYNGGPTRTVALLNTPSPFTDLPNPAFNVVPPDAELLTPVDGATTVCALPDQRGVRPAPGANCAIGAYLLQATTTTVSAPSGTIDAGAPVTLTASVEPEPDGGTVSFDDGPGNPAASQCTAIPVVHGKAECTISYESAGTYSVTATYSGDGDENNFAPSASGQAGAAEVTIRKAEPPVNPKTPRPLRIVGATANPRTGTMTVKVSIPAGGTVSLIGYDRFRSYSKDFDAKGIYRLKVTPKGKFKRYLAKRGRAYRLVKVKYQPERGQTLYKAKIFKFLRKLR